jgi:hypothetical protein
MGTRKRLAIRLKSKRFVMWFVSICVVAGILVTGVVLGRTGNTNPPSAKFLEISMGQHLTFDAKGSGLLALRSGWSIPEPWGTWSDGNLSTIALKLIDIPKQDPQMLIEGHAFLFGSHQSLIIKVDINGQSVATIDYGPGDKASHLVSVPLKIISSDGGRLLVHFTYDTPKSPLELGYSTKDPRKLGLGITGLQFNK